MQPEQNTERIRAEAHRLGFEFVGFARAERLDAHRTHDVEAFAQAQQRCQRQGRPHRQRRRVKQQADDDGDEDQGRQDPCHARVTPGARLAGRGFDRSHRPAPVPGPKG